MKQCTLGTVLHISVVLAVSIVAALSVSLNIILYHIPEFADFGSVTHRPEMNTTTDMNNTWEDNIPATSPNILCVDDFLRVNNSCVPHCEKFSSIPQIPFVFLDICESVLGITGVAALIIVIVASIKDWKEIFRFPKLFGLYILLNSGVLGIVTVIPIFIGARPFCQSSNLVESLSHGPTAFCKYFGIIRHYTLFSMVLWWFIHLSTMVFKLSFPFTAKQWKNLTEMKLFYWILSVLGFLAPVPAIAVSLATDEYKIDGLPPNSCIPQENIWFYSVILPISIFFAIGTCFLFHIFFTLRKIRGSVNSTLTISSAEIKVLIISTLYLISGIFNMVITGYALGYKEKKFSELMDFFQCEEAGHIPGKCSRRGFEDYIFPYLEGLSYLLNVPFFIGILNFVVNWKKFKCVKCGKQTAYINKNMATETN